MQETINKTYRGFNIKHLKTVYNNQKVYINSTVTVVGQTVLDIFNGSEYWANLKCERFIDLHKDKLDQLEIDLTEQTREILAEFKKYVLDQGHDLQDVRIEWRDSSSTDAK